MSQLSARNNVHQARSGPITPDSDMTSESCLDWRRYMRKLGRSILKENEEKRLMLRWLKRLLASTRG